MKEALKIDKEIDRIINEPCTFDNMKLEDMTDEWIEAGEYCDQTVIDLVALAHAQKAMIKALFKTRKQPDPWDHISPEYREGVTYTLHVSDNGHWYIKNGLLKGTAAARGEMGDVGRDGEKKTVRQGVWV